MRVYTATWADFEPVDKLYYAATSRQAAAVRDYYIATHQYYDVFAGLVGYRDSDVLVAEDEERAVGMAIVSVCERPRSPNISDRCYVLVSNLHFETEEVRDMLIAEAELWGFARNISHLQVCLHTQDAEAIKLYTGMGFTPETTIYSRQIPSEKPCFGLPRGTVKLYSHCREWELEGERTVEELKRLLRRIAVGVTHIGSTAVSSIPAKPIIDVLVAVHDFDKILDKRDLLQQYGYYYVPSASNEKQLLFAKGSFYDGTGDLQTHFIHVIGPDIYEWYDYVNFRDYLKEFHGVAANYAVLKLRLSREYPNDRAMYTASKQAFIRDVLDKASRHFHR